MNRSEAEELVSVLKTVGNLCENLNQRLLALENTLSPADRQRYDKELNRVRGRGSSTNAVLAVATLEEKLFPSDQS